jgi:type IV pilus assembly protein PilN
MIKINLFPFRRERIKENIRRQIGVYILSVIFLILLMVFPYNPFSYVSLKKEVKALNQKQDERQKELATFKDTTNKINKLKKTIAEVEVKLKTIRELEKVKTGPVKLLDDIATSVPRDKLWLTSLKENKGTLVLEGTAMDNETVADFMNRLENTESIQSVELVKTQQKEVASLNLTLKDFALRCKTYAFKEAPPPTEIKKKTRR